MGTVYLAQQEKPIRRKVAIKVIKPGMDSKEIVARFESEQQALALMNHPNIAQVHDSGETEHGYPYFVMEYVPGIPITEYCDKNKMTTEERLRLFEQVCDAMQHAHFKGIVHRDLKPSNILVAFQDNKHIPKIIDFGIAKALTGQGLTEKTLHTVHGLVIGTPIYMSPEQAELTGYDIDTRTDVYSLGVLLYELMIGLTPFEEKQLEKAGLMEIFRIIREEEPPRPSTRFSSLGDTSTEIAKRRGTNIIGLSKQLKGDLDWIVMKAIDKDRKRRYNSATELAYDIERYLNQEPIQARPPSVMYRITKYVRRHKAASLAFTFILLLIIFFSSWNVVERRKAEKALKDSNYSFAVALKEKAKLYAEKKQWQLVKLYALNSLLYQAKAQKYVSMSDVALPFEYQDWILKHSFSKNVDPASTSLTFTFSPDKKYLAIKSGFEGEIKVLDVSNWKEIAILRRHTGEIISLVFSLDSKHLASSSRDKTIKIWELSTGKEIVTLKGHQQLAYSIDFSPDGRYLVSGSWDKTAKIWDIYSGKELITLRGHEDRVFSVKLSPDGGRVATKSENGTIKLWEVTSGKEIAALKGHVFSFSRPLHLQTFDHVFSPEGKLLVIGLQRTIEIMDAFTGRTVARLEGHEDRINSVCFSPDGMLLASASNDRTIKIWEVPSGKGISTLIGHEDKVLCVSFSPDGKYLVSGSMDKSVKIWDACDFNEISSLIESKEEVGSLIGVDSVSFSPDGKNIYSESSSNLNIWELLSREVTTLKGHEDWVLAIRFSSDGNQLASASRDVTAKIWEVSSGRELASSKGNGRDLKLRSRRELSFSSDLKYLISYYVIETDKEKYVHKTDIWQISSGKEMTLLNELEGRFVRVSPDGKLLAAWDREKTIKILEVSTGKEIFTFEGEKGLMSLMEFSSDGRYFASGSDRETIKVWEILSGKEVSSLNVNKEPIQKICLSHDGRYLASNNFDDNQIKIWDVLKEKVIATIKGYYYVSISDKYLALSSWIDGARIKILELSSGKEIATFTMGDPKDIVQILSFSPDGRFLATGMWDRTIKIWEVSNGREITTLMGHKDAINSLEFSPDGKYLASGSSDRTIRFWDLDSILNFLWFKLEFPYRVEDLKKLIKDVETHAGFTLDVLTPVPLKRVTSSLD